MLHLQSGALAQAIPTIVHSLVGVASEGMSDVVGNILAGTNAAGYSILEGDVDEGTSMAERTTAVFSITRAPIDYDMPSAVTVVITRTSSGNIPADPNSFTVSGVPFMETNSVWEEVIVFASGQNEEVIPFSFVGDNDPNNDYVYTINIEPVRIPGGGSQQITFTISDDEDDIAPTLPGDGNNIVAIPGATQVTLRFDSAYDTIGSVADSSGRTYTRNVNYVISITRMENGGKSMLTLPSVTISAARAIVSETGLDLDITETF